MTESDRELLLAVSSLLEYPDNRFYEKTRDYRQLANGLAENSDEARKSLRTFLDWLDGTKKRMAQEHYVRIFDHDPAASLYLSWHRYGNDRGQGKAMAALNGLYRAAGFEPVPGVLPDYLPRVLEFLAVCEDWAAETLLDGFGPELSSIQKHLEENNSPYASLLASAIIPLRDKWPDLFQPRNGPDRTLRPLARPEQEECLFASCPHKQEQD